jgi:heptosyltransferase-2
MTPPPARPRYAARNPALAAWLWAIDHLWARPGRQPPALPEEPARILLCNQAHLGDAILATAALEPLRRRYPDAKIGMLVNAGSARVVADHPALAWVHTVDPARLQRQGSRVERLRRHRASVRAAEQAVRAVGYDLAIDLYHHYPNSIPLLHRIGVPTVGWRSGGFGAWLAAAPDDPASPPSILSRHAALLHLATGRPVDAAAMRPWLAVEAEALARWHARRQALGITRPCTVLHLGAHDAVKRWPLSHWQAVATRLFRDGHTVLLMGHGPREVADCAAVRQACRGCVDLAGQLDWPEFVAAVSEAGLLVGHDSAAVHVAAAFDRPRVAIVPGIVEPWIWHPPGPRRVTLSQPVPCAPCQRGQGCASMQCLRGVAPQAVVEAIGSLDRG